MDHPDERSVSPQVALADIDWYRDNPPSLSKPELEEIFRAAISLATVVRRTLDLDASRIGASLTVIRNDYDSVSFYQGVAFALAKVNQTLGAWEDGDG